MSDFIQKQIDASERLFNVMLEDHKQRCGEVNPAEIHTCTPIENLTTEKNIQTSDNND